MSANVFVAEQVKTLGRKVVWVVMAASGVFVASMLVLVYASVQRGAAMGQDTSEIPQVLWPHGLATTLADFLAPGYIGSVLAVVVAAVLWADEYRWRTLHLWLSRGISRRRLVAVKALAMVVPFLLIVTVSALVGGLTCAGLTLAVGEPLGGAVRPAQVGLGVVRATAAMLPMAGVTLVMGVLTRSTAGALGAGLGYAALVEKLIAAILTLVGLERLPFYLPAAISGTLAGYNRLLVAGAATPTLPVSAGVAFAGSLIWFLLLTLVAAHLMRKQDLGG
jgi:hypothetical protein